MENRFDMDLNDIGLNAKKASRIMASLNVTKKNEGLKIISEALLNNKDYILRENLKDIENAKNNGMSEALLDRLTLTSERIDGIALGVSKVISLDDPIGEVFDMKLRPNGLKIGQMRVPLGVIGIIYEARPNVTIDAIALCFKTGNSVILRGGSDAIYSNVALVSVVQDALEAAGLPKYSVNLIGNNSREVATAMMKLNEYIDVLIPRGGAGLIKSVVNNATVPVIETGTGNCHIYVDKSADLSMAIPIIRNSKLQRLGVCNACESLVIHRAIANEAIPMIVNDLKKDDCEIRGDESSMAIDSYIVKATQEDYKTEYLAKILSVKIVDSLDEAIEHINSNSTGHSESIITNDYEAAQIFLSRIDSAAVYVNASTRFTDGFEFGFGAEIGISTQKLHARGPMGLLALTTTKYIIYGNGQIR